MGTGCGDAGDGEKYKRKRYTSSVPKKRQIDFNQFFLKNALYKNYVMDLFKHLIFCERA